jgi:hypothetical protein
MGDQPEPFGIAAGFRAISRTGSSARRQPRQRLDMARGLAGNRAAYDAPSRVAALL